MFNYFLFLYQESSNNTVTHTLIATGTTIGTGHVLGSLREAGVLERTKSRDLKRVRKSKDEGEG